MADNTHKKFIEEKRTWYKTIGKVWCPILNQNIVFNSKGFYHLRYDSFGKARPKQEQMYKLGLLPLVIPVIKCATNIHEYKKEQYSKPLGKHFEIWELKEIVGQQRSLVSVVLRRIGNGEITFLSVWKKKEKKSGSKKAL
ncbi:MAG: hypothetical protein NTV48_02065 [Candidatus Vogelbacteria bacterium]|nr:hypothetical protein [Candidatus Vogelbacteria bacterium]